MASVTGFSGHAHLARTIQARFGTTPSALRKLLHEPEDSA